MRGKPIFWTSRIVIGLALLFLIFTLLFLLLEFNYGANYIAYVFYALMATGVVLAVVKYFRSGRADRRGQMARAIRFFVGLGLILLVLAIPFLLLGNGPGANFAADTSYVFLAIGVFLALVEYFQSEWREGKGKAKSKASNGS